jgi:hypothetical protein
MRRAHLFVFACVLAIGVTTGSAETIRLTVCRVQ